MKRAIVLLALGFAGCGPAGPVAPAPATCPDDAPSACLAPAPHFAADAAPIIAAHCAKCHTPGGAAETFPFQTYDQIAPYAGDINLQLQTCQMPQPPEPPLSPAERQALFGWILCGALDD